MKILKGQAALQYLSTYMWALLIIAVVLAILYLLGLFNGWSFAPKENPGSCYLSRPYGPFTSRYISFVGSCNGGLPKYVASFNGNIPGGSFIWIRSVSPFNTTTFTLSAWVYWSSTGNGGSIGQRILSYETENAGNPNNMCLGNNCSGFWLNINSVVDNAQFIVGNGSALTTIYGGPTIATNSMWYQVVATYTPSNMILYVNGQQAAYSSSPVLISFPTGKNITIGSGSDASYHFFFKGYIADVQIYNSTLTANDVLSLYNEGIGGVPIRSTSLLGWWPLNGDAKDYSGDNGNGAAFSVVYTGLYPTTGAFT